MYGLSRVVIAPEEYRLLLATLRCFACEFSCALISLPKERHEPAFLNGITLVLLLRKPQRDQSNPALRVEDCRRLTISADCRRVKLPNLNDVDIEFEE
jgi:hypothetical protein